MLYFATLFDKNYLTRGLALYNSMQEHIESFTLYILALDQDVVEYIKNKNTPYLKVLKLSNIEKKYPELVKAKNNRSIVEYYFTLSPVLPLYMLETFPEIDFITTLDADIFFFNNPKIIFDDFKDYSILITKHDFTDELKDLEIYGKYNVSFQSFRRDREGFECLKKWKKQCIDWCYDSLEGEKFADQKYLDTWTTDYKNVFELTGKGAGIAPWNISKYKILKKDKEIYCDNNKLIFYHFHGLRYVTKNIIKHELSPYKTRITKGIRNYIYKKYIKKISLLNKFVKFNDKNILRINQQYSTKEIYNLLIYDYTFYFLLNQFLINIHFLPIYNILKYSIYFPFLIIKRLLKK